MPGLTAMPSYRRLHRQLFSPLSQKIVTCIASVHSAPDEWKAVRSPPAEDAVGLMIDYYTQKSEVKRDEQADSPVRSPE